MFDRINAQLIDATMVQALHRDACRNHALVAWCVWYDHPAYPGRYIAQLATTGPLPYVLVGGTLAEVQEQLPSGLVWHPRQPGYAPEIVEVWVAD